MEAKRAAKIVSNLLVFSRQRQPERSSIDLNRVITDTLSLRRFVLSREQIEVETGLAPELPQTWADPFQLQQVLLNLLINAEQALRGRKGKRTLTLRTKRTGDRIVATVGDNGPGITDEMLSRMFEPFFTSKPVGEGSGLGLAISHGIVRQHGGELRARSTVGEGATFEIDLPIRLGQADASYSSLAGESLFAELVERDPDHAGGVIFATGDFESSPARQFLQGAGRPFVGKPFALSMVAALLTQTAPR